MSGVNLKIKKNIKEKNIAEEGTANHCLATTTLKNCLCVSDLTWKKEKTVKAMLLCHKLCQDIFSLALSLLSVLIS